MLFSAQSRRWNLVNFIDHHHHIIFKQDDKMQLDEEREVLPLPL